VILTSESVDEILWCDHSNETWSAVLSHGTISILVFLQTEILRICLLKSLPPTVVGLNSTVKK